MAKIKIQKENIKNNFNGDLNIDEAIFNTVLTKLYSEVDSNQKKYSVLLQSFSDTTP